MRRNPCFSPTTTRSAGGGSGNGPAKLVYEDFRAGLESVGQDRQLLEVVELRDGEDAGSTIEVNRAGLSISSEVTGRARLCRRAMLASDAPR